MQSNAILLVILATYLAAAMRGGAFYVFIANIAFSLFFPRHREIAGIALDSSDLMFFTIAAGCLLSSRFAAPLRSRTVPHLRLWVLLGCLISVSYVATERGFMSDPVRAAYQIYRYCWKPILYYPLAALLIQDTPRRSWIFASAIVIFGAIASTLQAGGFAFAEQFFRHKNIFGGALVAPAVLAVGLLLAQKRLLSRLWVIAAVGAIWVELILLGSRGAFVGAGFGAGLLVLGLLRHKVGRARTARLAAGAALAGATVIAVFPQLLSSQGLSMLAEMEQGTDVHNLQWRITERWPHYIAIIKANPWVGTGLLYDHTEFEEESAKGTHNGYLSVALQRGIPACVIFFCIPIASTLRARRAFRSNTIPGAVRVLVLASGAAVAGIMLHNLVDHTVVGPFTGQIFWTLSGIAAAAGLAVKRKPAGPVARAVQLSPRRTVAHTFGHRRLSPQERPIA